MYILIYDKNNNHFIIFNHFIHRHLFTGKEALEDLDQSFKWYEEKQDGVGSRFLNKVDEEIIFNHIISNYNYN